MPDLTIICQVRHKSCRSAYSVPLEDLRFINKDQLPAKRPHRLMLSLRDHWNIMINDYSYIRQSLFRIHCVNQTLLQNGGAEDFLEIRNLSDGRSGNVKDRGMIDYKFQGDGILEKRFTRVNPSKSPKNRRWEKRQTGYKAAWLRIDNVARVQKARMRYELRSSIDWQSLSSSERRDRETAVCSPIEKRRREKKERARAFYLEADYKKDSLL